MIFAGVFLMAAGLKFAEMAATAEYIVSAGFPFPLFLARIAAFFELALVLAFLTGAFFSEAALAAAGYMLFRGFAFHGPAHWQDTQMEVGFFVNHFTFPAGLIFVAVHRPRKAAMGARVREGNGGKPWSR